MIWDMGYGEVSRVHFSKLAIRIYFHFSLSIIPDALASLHRFDMGLVSSNPESFLYRSSHGREGHNNTQKKI